MELGAALLGPMEERQGLPRPQWEVVQMRWLALPEDERAAAWVAVERMWQRALAAVWAGDFRILEEGESLLTTDLSDAAARRVLRFMNGALATIERCLTGLGLEEYSDGGPGCDVAVVCRRVEDYLDYVCDTDEPMHVGAVSGGVCIHQGSVHVAAHGEDPAELEPVLAHELAHTRLAQLALPAWLEEGLVTHLEHAVAPSGDYEPSLQMAALHRGYWTPRRLEDFFTGEGFCGEDDAQGLPYHLAHAVVGNLMAANAARFTRLLKTATWQDRGESACRLVYGVGLGDLVPRFIRDAAAARADGDDALADDGHEDDDPEVSEE